MQLDVHDLFVEAKGTGTLGLGTAERDGGMLEQLVGVVAVGRVEGDADPDGDLGEMTEQIERLVERRQQPIAQGGGARRTVNPALDDRELVGAHAGEGVGLAHPGEQARAGVAQQQIPGGAAEGRVDRPEVGQIDGQHGGHALAAPIAADRAAQPLDQRMAIGQAGERVVPRQLQRLPGDSGVGPWSRGGAGRAAPPKLQRGGGRDRDGGHAKHRHEPTEWHVAQESARAKQQPETRRQGEEAQVNQNRCGEHARTSMWLSAGREGLRSPSRTWVNETLTKRMDGSAVALGLRPGLAIPKEGADLAVDPMTDVSRRSGHASLSWRCRPGCGPPGNREPRAWWSRRGLALALLLGGCAATELPGASRGGEVAGQPVEWDPPAGAIAVGDQLYQVPIGELDGCPIYRLYSPTRPVPQAVYYRDRQEGFTMDRNAARCAGGTPAEPPDADR